MSLEKFQNLREKIAETKKLLNIEELQKKSEQLAEDMNRPDFWSNVENAQAISQDYRDIKKEIDKFVGLEKRVSDLLELSESGDKSLLSEIEQQTTILENDFAEL